MTCYFEWNIKYLNIIIQIWSLLSVILLNGQCLNGNVPSLFRRLLTLLKIWNMNQCNSFYCLIYKTQQNHSILGFPNSQDEKQFNFSFYKISIINYFELNM